MTHWYFHPKSTKECELDVAVLDRVWDVLNRFRLSTCLQDTVVDWQMSCSLYTASTNQSQSAMGLLDRMPQPINGASISAIITIVTAII